MGVTSSSRGYHNLARLSIVLVTAALVVGMAGCPSPWPGDIYLSIASTLGGVVAEPGEGWFPYYAKNATVVELVAEADEHCHFVNWTGDVDTIDDVNDASTNITMYDSYSITANFELDEGCYSLTVLSNYGGSVSEPGEGYFAYVANTTIDLAAEPDEGYRFKEWAGDVDTIANVDAAANNITMDGSYSIRANFEWFDIIQIAAGCWNTLGLKNDGTVVAVGYGAYGQCNVGSWTDIIQVSAGLYHVVGLKSDGTVVATGWNAYGQCDVGNWTGITQVAAGSLHTVGLKNDGTVIAVGNNTHGQCDVGWTNITQVAAGGDHTVGLKFDGTVVAVGAEGGDDYGQCDVGNWTGITQVAAGSLHTVGLKNDGTVVAVGYRGDGQCNVGSWTDIKQVASSCSLTVGLRADGTAVTAGWDMYDQFSDVGNWTDIIQVAAGCRHTVGLKNDGTVIAAGWCGYGECSVGGWEPSIFIRRLSDQ